MSVWQGAPLPSQEQNAVNAVMQYAIHRLGFHPDSIILFAWSIGGYAASWAAMSYPDVKHVVSSSSSRRRRQLEYWTVISSSSRRRRRR